MSRGVGRRHSLDLVLLWLWCRLEAAAPIWPLAWELPYAASAALKSKKRNELLFLITSLLVPFSFDPVLKSRRKPLLFLKMLVYSSTKFSVSSFCEKFYPPPLFGRIMFTFSFPLDLWIWLQHLIFRVHEGLVTETAYPEEYWQEHKQTQTGAWWESFCLCSFTDLLVCHLLVGHPCCREWEPEVFDLRK